MVHRRQAIDVVGLIAPLAGFIVFISLCFPAVRRALGFMVVCLSVLMVLGLAGFSIYRLVTRGSRRMAENPFALPTQAVEPEAADPIWDDGESVIALDLFEPALRRRYPWRH
jgi:hypothetical protein